MQQVENNAFFWQKLDTLYVSSKVVFDRKKNTRHPKFDNLVYPVDYGFLQDTHSSDGSDIDIFKGSLKQSYVGAVAISVDTLKRDSEVKLLVGCTEEEIFKIMQFLNETEFQKAILVRRSDDMSPWAMVD